MRTVSSAQVRAQAGESKSDAGLGSKAEFALQLDQFDYLRDAMEHVLHLAF